MSLDDNAVVNNYDADTGECDCWEIFDSDDNPNYTSVDDCIADDTLSEFAVSLCSWIFSGEEVWPNPDNSLGCLYDDVVRDGFVCYNMA